MPEVVRVSVIRCDPERFSELNRLMIESEAVLASGIGTLDGFVRFWAGADPETSSLVNVSVWTSLDCAKQLDRFQPMLDLGKRFIEQGARFERPVMNYATLWTVDPAAP